MRPVASLLPLVALSAVCFGFSNGHAPPTNVTVVVSFEKPHSAVSIAAMQSELAELLEPAGVSVSLLSKSELPEHAEFSELVLFEMKGYCSMNAVPMPVGALSDERGPLAMAYSSNGEILHFGKVECDRVRACVQRLTGRGSPEKHQVAYGKALGLVMAHELYHMICGAKAHTRVGLTKESLSARDLLNEDLSMPESALSALRRKLSANH